MEIAHLIYHQPHVYFSHKDHERHKMFQIIETFTIASFLSLFYGNRFPTALLLNTIPLSHPITVSGTPQGAAGHAGQGKRPSIFTLSPGLQFEYHNLISIFVVNNSLCSLLLLFPIPRDIHRSCLHTLLCSLLWTLSTHPAHLVHPISWCQLPIPRNTYNPGLSMSTHGIISETFYTRKSIATALS